MDNQHASAQAFTNYTRLGNRFLMIGAVCVLYAALDQFLLQYLLPDVVDLSLLFVVCFIAIGATVSSFRASYHDMEPQRVETMSDQTKSQ